MSTESDINSGGCPAAKFRGWVNLVFTFLGVCVWGPSLAAAVGFPWAYAAIPLGMVLGPLVGFCVAQLVTPLIVADPTGESDQETEDAPN
jgi:hypothetical protein